MYSNQYMLYRAIKESDEKLSLLSNEICKMTNKLQDINNSAAITEYNTGVIAQNTEYLKWIKMLEQ